MHHNNETKSNQDAANNAASIYIALLGALCGVSILLTCFCLIRHKSKQPISVAESPHSIASAKAVAIQIEKQLPSDHRPGL